MRIFHVPKILYLLTKFIFLLNMQMWSIQFFGLVILLTLHHGQTDLLLPMNPAFAAPPPAALPVFPPVVAAAAPLPPPAFLPAAAPLVGPAPLLPYSVGAVLAPAPGPPPVAWNAFQTHWNNFHFMYNNPVLRRFLIGKK